MALPVAAPRCPSSLLESAPHPVVASGHSRLGLGVTFCRARCVVEDENMGKSMLVVKNLEEI